MILGFFFLFYFLETLEGREGFFEKKGGVSLVRNRDLRPAAKAYPTIQQAAKQAGQSVNAYIYEAVCARIEQENAASGTPGVVKNPEGDTDPVE